MIDKHNLIDALVLLVLWLLIWGMESAGLVDGLLGSTLRKTVLLICLAAVHIPEKNLQPERTRQ